MDTQCPVWKGRSKKVLVLEVEVSAPLWRGKKSIMDKSFDRLLGKALPVPGNPWKEAGLPEYHSSGSFLKTSFCMFHHTQVTYPLTNLPVTSSEALSKQASLRQAYGSGTPTHQ